MLSTSSEKRPLGNDDTSGTSKTPRMSQAQESAREHLIKR